MSGGGRKDVAVGRTVWKRVNLGDLALVTVDAAETGERVLAVDVHGARTTDAFSAGATEGESGVNFVLDLDEGVQDL